MQKIILLFIVFSFQAITAKNSSNYEVEELVVYGTRPGPELWKVSNGDNVLWIMGILAPLPKKMSWHSELVGAVIEDSQALLLPPNVNTDIGFFQGISLAASAIGIKKNPDKKKLIDVVPSDIYARWLVLKKKYLGNDRGVEKVRPIFASDKLFEKAIRKIGLTYNTKVRKKIRKIAKKNKLEFIEPIIEIELNKPKSAIKKFKKSQLSDLECFTKTLDRLEGDLNIMRLRAYAWAEGDVTKIKELKYPNQNQACVTAILNNEVALEMGMADIDSRLQDAWIKEAVKALNTNKSTFATLSVSNLLDEEGYLNSLKALGYSIDVPK